MSAKALLRLAGLLLLVVRNIFQFWLTTLCGRPSREERMAWLHRTCQQLVQRMGWKLRVEGTPPTGGLLVTNHLSYLDILFLGAATPCVFVSKIEVRKWPLFGLCANLSGTIYVNRSSRSNSRDAAVEVEKALAAGVTVLVFPEGTSTDGRELLLFHSTFFEPAVQAGVPVTAAAIGYHADNLPESALCYYGDIHFAPHLLETLGRDGFEAHIRFAEPRMPQGRREAAESAQEQIKDLRAGMAASEGASLESVS
jgi:1-acyl-sn-glycerol-3-phosphate acyltransferase